MPDSYTNVIYWARLCHRQAAQLLDQYKELQILRGRQPAPLSASGGTGNFNITTVTSPQDPNWYSADLQEEPESSSTRQEPLSTQEELPSTQRESLNTQEESPNTQQEHDEMIVEQLDTQEEETPAVSTPNLATETVFTYM